MNDNEYMRVYMKGHSKQRKQKVHDFLGGKCSRCGTESGLEVHHRDPAEKEFTLSSRWHCPWADLLREAKKCELLCGDCHRKEHGSKALHGTAQRYWRGCRCQPCKAANAEHSRNYKARRRQFDSDSLH